MFGGILNRDHNFYLDTLLIEGLKDFKVSILINENGSSWNVNLISELFLPSDAEAITRIPLSISRREDLQI